MELIVFKRRLKAYRKCVEAKAYYENASKHEGDFFDRSAKDMQETIELLERMIINQALPALLK